MSRRLRWILVAASASVALAAAAHYRQTWEYHAKRTVKALMVKYRERELRQHRARQRATPLNTAETVAPPPSEPVIGPVAPAPPPDKAPKSLPAPASSWPGYLGPGRDGRVTEKVSLRGFRGGKPKLLWRQPIGGGLSSFAIAGGRAFTLEQRGAEEALTAYDLNSGAELWQYAWPGNFQPGQGGPGPRSTPWVADGKVYALGAAGTLVCADLKTGKPLWTRNILADSGSENLLWGVALSPFLREGLLFVAPGGQGSSVIAYRTGTGEPAWKSGSHPAAYASPAVATLAGVPHLLVFDGDGISAYQPGDGKELWHFPWKTELGLNASQPLVLDETHVFVSSSYGAGSALLAVSKDGGQLKADPVWRNTNLKLKYTSAVVNNGHIYGADDGIFVCLNARTGARKWKGGRFGHAHVLGIGGLLLVLCENGDLALLEANPEKLVELARVPALDGTVNPPAAGEGKLLVRNHIEMMCFSLD